MNSVCVFCGSSPGASPIYVETAFELGKTLAERGIRLVYGGARVGLMGALADGCLQNGGTVIGVLPLFLSGKEIGHEGLSEMILVNSMHERKLKMHDLSEGVIALPGGFGTLEELFEMLTWAQLGLHTKPIGMLNLNGYYDGLLTLSETMVREGLLRQENANMLLSAGTIPELLDSMINYNEPPVPKWMTSGTT